MRDVCSYANIIMDTINNVKCVAEVAVLAVRNNVFGLTVSE